MGINDELSGQAVNAFVSLKEGNETNDQIKKDLVLQVRKSIGPFAAPKAVFIIDDLPKTRSGKIMRRILRKILSGEEDSLGDISTVRTALLDRCFKCVDAEHNFSYRIQVWLTRSLRPFKHRVRSEQPRAIMAEYGVSISLAIRVVLGFAFNAFSTKRAIEKYHQTFPIAEDRRWPLEHFLSYLIVRTTGRALGKVVVYGVRTEVTFHVDVSK